VQPLPQGVLAHERVELADQHRVPTEREISVDPVLKRSQTLLLEPHSLVLRESLICEIRERRATPQRQRVSQSIARPPCIPLSECLAALFVNQTGRNPSLKRPPFLSR